MPTSRKDNKSFNMSGRGSLLFLFPLEVSMPRKAKPNPRSRRQAPAKVEARRVLCVCEEVFTGLWKPERLRKGEQADLPARIAEILIQSGACADV